MIRFPLVATAFRSNAQGKSPNAATGSSPVTCRGGLCGNRADAA
ncbi:hypothetical protein [uncultured Paracoccus sp.]|nr:hypothetical protein [uncultured Paracoccus sp.]